MVSGAGHDSCNVAAVAPTAMIFVPCAGGLSHNEAESRLARRSGGGRQRVAARHAGRRMRGRYSRRTSGAGRRSPRPRPAADAPGAPAPAITAVHCGHLIDTAAGKMLGRDHDRDRGGPHPRRERRQARRRRERDRSGDADLHAGTHRQLIPTSPARPAARSTSTSSIGTSPTTRCAPRSMRAARCWPDSPRCAISGIRTTSRSRCAMPSTPGSFPGPRIFTAGKAIGSTGGHADPTNGYRMDLAGDPGPTEGIINSPDDAVKAVRLHYKRRRRSDQDHALGRRAGRERERRQCAAHAGGNPRRRRDRARLWIHGGGSCARRRSDSPRRDRRRRFHRTRHLHGRRRT